MRNVAVADIAGFLPAFMAHDASYVQEDGEPMEDSCELDACLPL